MPPRKKKNIFNTTEHQKQVELALRLYKQEDIKVKTLKNKLTIDLQILSILQKCTLQHQSKLLLEKDDVVEHSQQLESLWGQIPMPEQVEQLQQLLLRDVSAAETYTRSSLHDCNVSILSSSKDEIKKKYKACLTAGGIQFTLQLESINKVLTGDEQTYHLSSIEFKPALPELLPLQEYLLERHCPHIIIRNLHDLQKLKKEQERVRVWSEGTQQLKAEASRCCLVLSYVPLPRHPFLSRSQAQKRRADAAGVNDENVSAEKRAEENSPASMSSDIEEPLQRTGRELTKEVSEDDMTIKLNWQLMFSENYKTFINAFELMVAEAVLARYSRSPVFQLLNRTVELETAADVIRLFSAFTH